MKLVAKERTRDRKGTPNTKKTECVLHVDGDIIWQIGEGIEWQFNLRANFLVCSSAASGYSECVYLLCQPDTKSPLVVSYLAVRHSFTMF